jgi:predicted nucleic acid-binding Zn ribbon protein
VVFKGSGWYVNDYGKGSPNPQKTETPTKEKKDSAKTSAKKPKPTNKSTSKKEKSGNTDN